MGMSDIGNDPVIRHGHFGKHLYFPYMAGSHFYNGYFMFLLYTEQGERNPDMIVQVALGGQDVVLLGKNRGNKFLGGRFTVCTCYTYNRCF